MVNSFYLLTNTNMIYNNAMIYMYCDVILYTLLEYKYIFAYYLLYILVPLIYYRSSIPLLLLLYLYLYLLLKVRNGNY